MRIRRWLLVVLLVGPCASYFLGPWPCTGGQDRDGKQEPRVHLWLSVLHNNAGESHLIDAGQGLEDFGGVARFATLVRLLRREATRGPRSPLERQHGGKRGVVMLSSGDNYLAGPEFNASLKKGVPFYDTMAMKKVRYDATAIGSHEFDFGPEVFADFVRGFKRAAHFVSANLDFSQEPDLQRLADRRRITRSVIVRERGQRIGIVGATTPTLPYISSPRKVKVDPDVARAVQKEIDAFAAQGVHMIILISHLQGIQEDLALASALRGVDIMVSGGGEELLANEGDLLIPGDEGNVYGPYPLTATDGDGRPIPVVTTGGGYRYVGRLVVGFDADGEIVMIDRDNSGPVRVAGGDNPDAVRPCRSVYRRVTKPVKEAIEALAANVVGNSEVPLDGREEFVRTVETNGGDLVADAVLYQASLLADRFGVPAPDIALQNGGGIRNDTVIGPGPISELDTFDMLPFSSFVSIVVHVPPAQLKEILENSVSRVEFIDGRFAQIAGFSMVWNPLGDPQTLDDKGQVVTPATRIRDVLLKDGTYVVRDGQVLEGAPSLTVATIDFLARGGDQYPFRDAAFTNLGVTYQQALFNYIREGLGGMIKAEKYPQGSEGRIVRSEISSMPRHD